MSEVVGTTRVNRRQVLGAAMGTLAASALLTRNVGAQDATPEASPVAAEWSFTDDKGVTVTLPSRPVRIVADVNAAAPLWDYGIRPVAVFGWNAADSGDFRPAGGNIDVSQVAVVGNEAEPIKPEATAAQNPDLIITITWEPENPTEYWSIEPDILPQVTPIAPILAISATGLANVNTERFAELAAALGADLGTPELQAAKTDYEASLEAFRAKAAEKADLSVVFTYVGSPAKAYIASPQDWADLAMYQSLGLNIVQPDVDPLAFWQEISSEEALLFPADVLLTSSRPATLSLDELKAHPTWGLHPAIKAGQFGAWNQDFIMSYQGMKAALDATIGVVANANKVT